MVAGRKRGLVVDGASIDPQAGNVVQHYKGALYIVLMRARDEESGDDLVVYTLCKAPDRGPSQVWVRTLSAWCSEPRHGVCRYRAITIGGKGRG